MSSKIKSLTVYCASSTQLAPEFHDVAVALGKGMAEEGIDLIYGGGGVGLMGEIADAVRTNGGRTVGIITNHLMDRELGDTRASEMIVVNTMRERKKLLEERGDGFIMLPGGIGTYEEFFEILVGRKLREHRKPIGIVNAHGYYDPLMTMIQHGVEHNFIKPAIHELFHINEDAAVVLHDVLHKPVVDVDDSRLLPMGEL